MPNEQVADLDAEWRMLQARALLDLFENDCGRPAAAMSEIREWANAQDQDHLLFRMTIRVHRLNPACSAQQADGSPTST